MACCATEHGSLTAADLDDALDDPTLEDCCRRDLQQQARSAQLVKQLRQHDRTTERSKMADNVFALLPLPSDPYDGVCCEHHGTDTCCQGTDLQRLREQRLHQLRAAAARQRDAAALQYGVLHEAPQTEALAMLQLAQLCVCHMASGARSMDQAVDQLLRSLACTHMRTLFLRAPFQRDAPLADYCRMPGPGLVCLRGGKPISAGPHQAFAIGGGLPDGDAILAWLQQAGVLSTASDWQHTQQPLERDSEGSEADDWDEPCTVCGRRYPHQHVAALSGTQQDESDGEG